MTKLIPGKLYLVTEDTDYFYSHNKQYFIKMKIEKGCIILYLAKTGSTAFEKRETSKNIYHDLDVCLFLHKNEEYIIYEKYLAIKAI